MSDDSGKVREWWIAETKATNKKSFDRYMVYGSKVKLPELNIQVIEYSAYDQLKAERDHLRQLLKEVRDALDKMLLAACWFHEGPSGPSPEVDDYKSAQKIFAKLTVELGE